MEQSEEGVETVLPRETGTRIVIVDDDDDSFFFFLHSGPEEPRIVARIVFNENVKSRRRKLGEKK